LQALRDRLQREKDAEIRQILRSVESQDGQFTTTHSSSVAEQLQSEVETLRRANADLLLHMRQRSTSSVHAEEICTPSCMLSTEDGERFELPDNAGSQTAKGFSIVDLPNSSQMQNCDGLSYADINARSHLSRQSGDRENISSASIQLESPNTVDDSENEAAADGERVLSGKTASTLSDKENHLREVS